MPQNTYGELISIIIAIFTAFIGMVAWFIRLESAVKRNTERIADNEEALQQGDNRMNLIDGRIIAAINTMSDKIEKAAVQSVDTSKAVAKIEGMLMYKERMEHQS